MPRETEFLAREICRRAGYDPDQIVAEIDGEKDFDYVIIGLAPVNILKLQPIFMKFIDEASRQLKETEPSKEGSNTATSSA